MKTEKQTVAKAQPPVKKFRAGNVTASVWKKDVVKDKKTFTFYTTTIERSYKDKDEEWKTTSSFEKDDLQKVMLVSRLAQEFLYLAEEKEQE